MALAPMNRRQFLISLTGLSALLVGRIALGQQSSTGAAERDDDPHNICYWDPHRLIY